VLLISKHLLLVGIVRDCRSGLSLSRVVIVDVIVVASIAVEVGADQKRAHSDTWVAKVSFALRRFIGVSAGAIARLTFIYEVLLALVRI